ERFTMVFSQTELVQPIEDGPQLFDRSPGETDVDTTTVGGVMLRCRRRLIGGVSPGLTTKRRAGDEVLVAPAFGGDVDSRMHADVDVLAATADVAFHQGDQGRIGGPQRGGVPALISATAYRRQRVVVVTAEIGRPPTGKQREVRHRFVAPRRVPTERGHR